jgi:hypothetical protein
MGRRAPGGEHPFVPRPAVGQRLPCTNLQAAKAGATGAPWANLCARRDAPGRLGQVSLYRKIVVVVPDDEDKRQAVPTVPVSQRRRNMSLSVVTVWRPGSRKSEVADLDSKWTPRMRFVVLWQAEYDS